MSEVTNNEARSRYEISVDGKQAGFAAYSTRGTSIVFTHTEIDTDHEGKGLGGALVRAALDDVRARGIKMVPQCPFVKDFLKRHPEYEDLRE